MGIKYERGWRKAYSLLGTKMLVFKVDRVKGAHIFRMAYFQPRVICEETVRAACRAAGIKGVSFKAAAAR